MPRRSVQANEDEILTARDVATNFPSPEMRKKRSHAVQTQQVSPRRGE